MSLIETSNLEKTYLSDGAPTPVLRDISLKIERGQFAAIMGPSGSGKSTLLHILGFLDRPSGGQYKFAGRSIAELSDAEQAKTRNRQMGFVFQAFNLLPRASVLENVLLPLVYSDTPETERLTKARAAVESVGLTHRLNYLSSQLSGGEKQRVAIARALVNRPEVLFADEPTGNLDSRNGRLILETIKRLNRESGQTVILVTHEPEFAGYADRIIQLKDGQIENDTKM